MVNNFFKYSIEEPANFTACTEKTSYAKAALTKRKQQNQSAKIGKPIDVLQQECEAVQTKLQLAGQVIGAFSPNSGRKAIINGSPKKE